MRTYLILVIAIIALAVTLQPSTANPLPLPTNAAQYVDRILRPCAAGATPYVSVITTATGNVALTTCAGGQATINGAPIGTGSGTVTSVGLALPGSVFNVTGSPVITAGTLTGSFANQTANTFFLGPATGAAAVPAFRAIVPLDLGTGTADTTTFLRGDLTWQPVSGGGITSLNTLTAATQTFAVGSTGSDFNIVSATSTHTFNLPDASTTTRGAIHAGAQTLGGLKTFANGLTSTTVATFRGAAALDVNFTGSGLTTFRFDGGNTALLVADNARVIWSSDSQATGAGDTGLSRIAAGVLEVNSGSTGVPRDLRVRNLQTSVVTVATLPTCNAGAAGMRSAVSDADTPAFLVTVVGGGAVVAPVFCNGTNWVVG